MNLLKNISTAISSLFAVVNQTATTVLPSGINSTANLFIAAEVATENVVVSSIIDGELETIELLTENPSVSADRVNTRLKARGLKFTVPTDIKPNIPYPSDSD